MPALFWDTDALLTACALNFVDDIAAILDCAGSAAYRLPAAPKQIRQSRTFKRSFDTSRLEADALNDYRAALADRARQLTQLTPDFVDTPTELEQAGLSAEIDQGELLLLQATASTSEGRILTSDKRALRGLSRADHPALIQLRERLQGRVVYLPHLLPLLAQHLGGLAALDSRWRQSHLRQRTLTVIFGSPAPVSPEAFVEALAAERRDLADRCDPQLFYRSP
ncbi:MAG: hypothetical protein AAF772_02065 [Acidobacteriota bacterium]